MKYRLTGILLFALHVCFAQVFTIEKIYKNDSAYEFPVIRSALRPDVAKKNQHHHTIRPRR